MKNEPHYQGTFMRTDILPKSGCFVLNLDKSENSGTHWVAVHCDKNIYYDSFGLPPPLELAEYKIKYYNTIQHQQKNSALCGLYACLFLKLLNRGQTFYNICYNLFKFKNYNKINHANLKLLLRKMS